MYTRCKNTQFYLNKIVLFERKLKIFFIFLIISGKNLCLFLSFVKKKRKLLFFVKKRGLKLDFLFFSETQLHPPTPLQRGNLEITNLIFLFFKWGKATSPHSANSPFEGGRGMF